MSENNGRDNDPKFGIVRAPDPDQQLILNTRLAILREPKSVVSWAVKGLLLFLLDRSLNKWAPGWTRRGVIVATDAVLAAELNASETSITRWKKKAVDSGYAWISKLFRKGSYPLTVYHVTALDPKPAYAGQNPDGSVRSGPGRPAPAPHAQPRAEKGRFGPLEKVSTVPFWRADPDSPPLFFCLSPERTEALRQFCRQRGGNSAASEAAKLPPLKRQFCRLTSGSSAASQAAVLPPQKPQPVALAGGKVAGLKRVSVRSRSRSKEGGEGEPPPDVSFEGWKVEMRSTFSTKRDKIRAKLVADRQAAQGEDKEWFSARIAFLDELLLGGKPPVTTKTKPGGARMAPKEDAPATEEELAAHQQFMAERAARKGAE